MGTKTPASLKEIPQSVTVYTQDYLKDRQFVHLDDLAKYTAGLRTLTNDSPVVDLRPWLRVQRIQH